MSLSTKQTSNNSLSENYLSILYASIGCTNVFMWFCTCVEHVCVCVCRCTDVLMWFCTHVRVLNVCVYVDVLMYSRGSVHMHVYMNTHIHVCRMH